MEDISILQISFHGIQGFGAYFQFQASEKSELNSWEVVNPKTRASVLQMEWATGSLKPMPSIRMAANKRGGKAWHLRWLTWCHLLMALTFGDGNQIKIQNFKYMWGHLGNSRKPLFTWICWTWKFLSIWLHLNKPWLTLDKQSTKQEETGIRTTATSQSGESLASLFQLIPNYRSKSEIIFLNGAFITQWVSGNLKIHSRSWYCHSRSDDVVWPSSCVLGNKNVNKASLFCWRGRNKCFKKVFASLGWLRDCSFRPHSWCFWPWLTEGRSSVDHRWVKSNCAQKHGFVKCVEKKRGITGSYRQTDLDRKGGNELHTHICTWWFPRSWWTHRKTDQTTLQCGWVWGGDSLPQKNSFEIYFPSNKPGVKLTKLGREKNIHRVPGTPAQNRWITSCLRSCSFGLKIKK